MSGYLQRQPASTSWARVVIEMDEAYPFETAGHLPLKRNARFTFRSDNIVELLRLQNEWNWVRVRKSADAADLHHRPHIINVPEVVQEEGAPRERGRREPQLRTALELQWRTHLRVHVQYRDASDGVVSELDDFVHETALRL